MRKKVIVLGTTSDIQLVNSSLRRLGRFGDEVLINLPSEKERYETIKHKIKSMCKSANEFLRLSEHISTRTPGFVIADITLLELKLYDFSISFQTLD